MTAREKLVEFARTYESVITDADAQELLAEIEEAEKWKARWDAFVELVSAWREDLEDEEISRCDVPLRALLDFAKSYEEGDK